MNTDEHGLRITQRKSVSNNENPCKSVSENVSPCESVSEINHELTRKDTNKKDNKSCKSV